MTSQQIGMVLALTAALLWSIGPIIAGSIIKEIGVMRFARLRYLIAAPMVGVIAYFRPGTDTVASTDVWLIMVSAVLGLVMAEACFFKSIHLIGARRATLLQAFNIVFIVVFGYLFLGEDLRADTTFGIALCFIGILVAVAERTKAAPKQKPDGHGARAQGIILGLLAGLGQAGGILALRPVMADGVDVFMATFLRISFAAGATFLIAVMLGRLREYRVRPMLFLAIAASGILSNILGTLFLTGALSLANAAIVGTISALSPVLIIPIVVALGHEKLSLPGLMGAGLAFAGTAKLLMG